MTPWFQDALMDIGLWIVVIFAVAYIGTWLTGPGRSRGKYAGFVRHRAPIQFTEPRPQLTLTQTRCEWGLHLVEPSQLVKGQKVAICRRCQHLRDTYPTTQNGDAA